MNLPQRIRWLLFVEILATMGVVFVAALQQGQPEPKLFGGDDLPVGIILNAQVLLLAMWAALGGGAYDVRLAYASLAAVAVLWAPCFVNPINDAWWLPVIYAGGMVTAPVLMLLRRRMWRVVVYPPDAVPHAPPWQFSMRWMFFAMTIAAVVFACRPWMIGISSVQTAPFVVGAVLAHLLQAVACVWAVLRAGRPGERIAALSAAVFLAPLMHLEGRTTDYPAAMTIAFVEQMLLIIPLLLVRTLGVRLVVQSAELGAPP